jgi:D-glycero-D-manno-heptose 1,7-bisphosphate phosphatase
LLPSLKPAVFLDRDGTLIEHVHYLADPGQVRLLPEAAQAIQLLRQHGFACVVISNQSAVGRGLLSLERLGEIHQEMLRQLAKLGAALDGLYFCPVAPSSSDRSSVDHPDRKPGPGMLLRAARELRLDLANSWMVGDLLSDMLAGKNAGCRATILVRTGQYEPELESDPSVKFVEDNLLAAARRIVCSRSTSPKTSYPLPRYSGGE